MLDRRLALAGHRRRRGGGRRLRGLDGAERAGVHERLGQRRDHLRVGVLGRAAAAVAREAGAVAGDQHPLALERRLVRVDLGDAPPAPPPSSSRRFSGVAAAPRPGIENGSALRMTTPPFWMPLVPAVNDGRAEVQRLLGRLEHLAEPRPAVEADRHLAHLLELRVDPELLELPHGPLGGVVVGVGAGFAAAEAVAGVVVPGHHLVVGRFRAG